MPHDEEELRRLVEVIGVTRTDGGTHLEAIRSDVPIFQGTTSPVLGLSEVRQRGSGLIVPGAVTGPALSDYIGVYVTADEYIPGAASDSGEATALARSILSSHEPRAVIGDLAILLLQFSRHDQDEVTANYLAGLPQPARALLEATLSEDPGAGQGHLLLSRQALLAALRLALDPDPASRIPDLAGPPWFWGVLSSHLIASTLYSGGPGSSGSLLPGVDDKIAMQITQNEIFHAEEDPVAVIDRHIRLWQDYDDAITVDLPASPTELLRESTGLDLMDLVALGFALWAFINAWEPGRTTWMRSFNSGMAQATIDRFTALISRTPEEFRSALASTDGEWDFLVFQDTPVVELDGELLVIDRGLLLDRITSGLFWWVHDHVKERGGDLAAQKWRQAYGQMYEALAGDSIKAMAPPLVAGGGSTFFTEEDLGTAYPDRKRCDFGADFGTEIGLFDVVSGRIAVATRIGGAVDALERDIERLVIKKARQLDDSAQALWDDPAPILGDRDGAFGIIPTVVAVEGFPLNPVTSRRIEALLESEGLLEDARAAPICIIDMGDLEMLEGIHEHFGTTPVTVLRGWGASPLREMSLRNYLLHEYRSQSSLLIRPDRMKGTLEATFDRVIATLDIRE